MNRVIGKRPIMQLTICLVACCAFLGFFEPLLSQGPKFARKAGSILILKKDHTLELLQNGKVIRTYK